MLFFGGCNSEELSFDNLYLEEASPTIALNLGYGSYTTGKLLEELEGEDYTIDSTNTVVELRFDLETTVVTRGDLLEDTEVVDVEPVSQVEELTPFRSIDFSSIGGSLTNASGTTRSLADVAADVGLTINFDDLIDTLEFEFVGEQGTEITEIYYRSGYFIFQLFGYTTEYELQGINIFNSDTDENMLITSDRDESEQISLGGFYSDFEFLRDPDDEADDSLNFVQYRLSISDVLLLPGQSIDNNSTISISVLSNDPDLRTFEAAIGSFREQTFEVDEESIKFDAFSDFTDGTIAFQDPQIIIDIVNYLGVPVTLDLSGITVKSRQNPDGAQIQIKDSSLGDIAPVAQFERRYEDIVPAETQIIIDRNTTNIDELLAGIPNEFILEATANILKQPGSFTTVPENESDTVVKVGGRAVIPLDALITDVEETFDFEGIDNEDITQIESASAIIRYKNSLSMQATAQLGFVSATNDTTFAASILELTKNVEISEFEGADIENLEPASISLDASETSDLLSAQTILVRLDLSSPPGENTVLTTDQEIYFELSILAGLTIEF